MPAWKTIVGAVQSEGVISLRARLGLGSDVWKERGRAGLRGAVLDCPKIIRPV